MPPRKRQVMIRKVSDISNSFPVRWNCSKLVNKHQQTEIQSLRNVVTKNYGKSDHLFMNTYHLHLSCRAHCQYWHDSAKVFQLINSIFSLMMCLCNFNIYISIKTLHWVTDKSIKVLLQNKHDFPKEAKAGIGTRGLTSFSCRSNVCTEFTPDFFLLQIMPLCSFTIHINFNKLCNNW